MRAVQSVFQIGSLLLVLAGMIAGAGLSARAQQSSLDAAVAYLQKQEASDWTLMALAAAGRAPDASSLKDTASLSSATDVARRTLALTALGKDPRSFPAENLVEKLKGFFDGTQLGSSDTLNDDTWGILALRSSGVETSDPVIAASSSFILANQNEDGGWGWALGQGSDTNDTAVAVISLLESGVSSSHQAIQNAVSYLKSSQNEDGGFPYDPVSPYGTDSDANSDAWAAAALSKLGQQDSSWQKPGGTPVEHLMTLQAEEGWFAYQPGAGSNSFTPATTAQAVIALAGTSYPVGRVEAPREPVGAEADFRIEGSGSQVCRGTVVAVTALDAVKNAAEQCGYSFTITQEAWGPYLKAIGADEAEGSTGWMYRVNWEMPNIGAADYALQQGDEVLWHYGLFDDQPLRLRLANPDAPVFVGDEVSGTVEASSGGSWLPAEGAQVAMNGASETTDAAGAFTFLVSQPGAFELRVEKEGGVRSDTLAVVVAEALQEIELQVEIEDGGAPSGPPSSEGSGSEAAFTVAPVSGGSKVDFGAAAPGGGTASSSVKLENKGSRDLEIQAWVNGDQVFKFLRIDQALWSQFQMLLGAGASQEAVLELAIPAAFKTPGAKSGSLIFWGQSAP